MALGHFIVLITHDGRAVDILRDFPPERLIKQIIFWCRGKIFLPAYNMGNPHQMVVDHIREVIRRQPVPLDEDLIIQLFVVHNDITEDLIVKARFSFCGDLLTNDKRLAGIEVRLDLLG